MFRQAFNDHNGRTELCARFGFKCEIQSQMFAFQPDIDVPPVVIVPIPFSEILGSVFVIGHCCLCFPEIPVIEALLEGIGGLLVIGRVFSFFYGHGGSSMCHVLWCVYGVCARNF